MAGSASVGGPASAEAWRIGVESRTAVFDRVPGLRSRPSRWLTPEDAPGLLVVGRARSAAARCWLHVQLPWRPNGATGWINADKVVLQPTRWRIVISTADRTLTLVRAGAPVRTVPVVVGKPTTPTPSGRFAVVWVIPWHANDFLGSWVLELSAHSNVLQQFDGGDGTIGIHGRGGASLLDPLGSALSHGCIRLSNTSIDWLVHTVGAQQLPGTPVDIA
jgi:lipoprotein-anchoring transpeptidase ErfK/SrfK